MPPFTWFSPWPNKILLRRAEGSSGDPHRAASACQGSNPLEGKRWPSFVWEDVSAEGGCRLHERCSQVGGETGEERKPHRQWRFQAFNGRLWLRLSPVSSPEA